MFWFITGNVTHGHQHHRNVTMPVTHGHQHRTVISGPTFIQTIPKILLTCDNSNLDKISGLDCLNVLSRRTVNCVQKLVGHDVEISEYRAE